MPCNPNVCYVMYFQGLEGSWIFFPKSSANFNSNHGWSVHQHIIYFLKKYLLISCFMPSSVLDAKDTTGKANEIKVPAFTIACICWFHDFSFMDLLIRKSVFYNSMLVLKISIYWSPLHPKIKPIMVIYIQVDVSLYATITKYHRPGDLNHRNLFLTVLTAGKFQVNVLAR